MTPATSGRATSRLGSKRSKLVHYYTAPWDDYPGGSAPVLLIVVVSLDTGRPEVFGVHLVAESKGIKPEDVVAHLPELERAVLEQFFSFVRANPRDRWLSWNMTNVQFGFHALAHRYESLGGKPVLPDPQRQHHLKRLLERQFGEDFVRPPHLENLVRLNGLSEADYLTHEQLAAAFRADAYGRMLRSLLRVVDNLASIFNRFNDGTLMHNGLLSEESSRLRQVIGPRLRLASPASLFGRAADPRQESTVPRDPPDANTAMEAHAPRSPSVPTGPQSTEPPGAPLPPSGDSRKDQPTRWSTPTGLHQWAKIFSVSPTTMSRLFKEGKVRHRRLSRKTYQVAIEDIPAKHQAQFLPEAG